MLVLVIIMVLELYISNNTELSAMQAFGFLSFPIVILVVVTIFSILAINKPFIQEFREVSDRIIAGDVSTKIEAEEILDDSVFGPIGHLLNSIMGNIETNVVQISETNTLIRATSDLLATNTEEINASAEEVASTSQSMSHGASSQTDMIAAVSDEIKNTTRIVDEIVSSIRSNTNQVAQIALQTNILALNAGIEASRAGDYGRGFAVVAENIRKLSDQSKIASENISEVADEIAARLEEAFDRINSTTLNVVSVSEETAASSEEVAAAAEEMTANMAEVADMALKLSEQVERSKEQLNLFVKDIEKIQHLAK